MPSRIRPLPVVCVRSAPETVTCRNRSGYGGAVPRRPDLPWTWGDPVDPAPTPPHYEDQDASELRLATRSVVAHADPNSLYVWLCQLRRAPYSYDWIDNLGRRSPRTPEPALVELAPGMTIMTIFSLVDHEPERALTIRMRPGMPRRVFGDITVEYRIDPITGSTTRLSAMLWLPPIGGAAGRLRRYLLAWGDVLMMRRQLLTLSRLAEG